MFQVVYPEQLNPPTSQQLCLLCHTSWHINSRAHYLSGNVGRTCNGSGDVWNWEPRSRCREHWKRLIRFAVTSNNIFLKFMLLIVQRRYVISAIDVETTTRNASLMSCENQHQKFWFVDLRIRVSTFRICYANAADQVPQSDLKRKSKIAAVIMKWLSQGIPLICGNVGTYKHFWILRSSHE